MLEQSSGNASGFRGQIGVLCANLGPATLTNLIEDLVCGRDRAGVDIIP